MLHHHPARGDPCEEPQASGPVCEVGCGGVRGKVRNFAVLTVFLCFFRQFVIGCAQRMVRRRRSPPASTTPTTNALELVS